MDDIAAVAPLRIGVVVLAAGAATRMGSPKQALVFRGQTLLQHAVQVALSAQSHRVVVVTGANQGGMEAGLPFDSKLVKVHNPDWQEGMGSSIRRGLTALLDSEPAQLDGVILMVCDQPFVTAALLDQLIATLAATSKGIVASHYNNTHGTPVLFSQNYFEELLGLNAQVGAKKLLQRYAHDKAAVAFAQGGIDIDTPEDYAALIT
ncbi:nucleotidyltransferase family protein [Pontibacter sp. CAU 1760]